MAKKKAQPVTPEQKEQRKTLAILQRALLDLHDTSLMVLADQGILPPLYGGEYLEEDREVIPLWGEREDGIELGALILRVVPDVEPDPDLEEAREEMGLENDWPIAELIDLLKMPDGSPTIEGANEISDLSMLLMLMGSQVNAAPGYDRAEMIDHVADMQPYAVFVIVPTSGDGDELTYLWDKLEDFRAEVVFAESPQLLEAAVWEYRLDKGLKDEIAHIAADGGNPSEELLALDIAGLSAVYEILVMKSLRFYGTTSPVRSKQLDLDVLREESGDLAVTAPLKPAVEPIPYMAEARVEITADDNGEVLRLSANSPTMQQVWPQIRASRYFCLKARYGIYKEGR